MVLTDNEDWLLAMGYTFEKEDIRIPIKQCKMWRDGEIINAYFIDDMEAAKKLHKRYEKTYRRKFNICTEKFIESSLIVQMINEDTKI